MNEEVLYEILKSKSETFTLAEIENIMNEELDKSTQEMDTDLIDLCLDILTSASESKSNSKAKKLRISKVLIAAAVFVVVVCVSMSVGAKFLNINVPNGLVSFCHDWFNIDASDDGEVDNIESKLIDDGIENVALPDVVFKESTEIYGYSKNISENSVVFEFCFKTTEFKGYVTLQKYFEDYEFAIDESKATSEFENAEYFDINGVNVFVFGKNDLSIIEYSSYGVQYSISMYCDYETACQIAKTL